MRPGGILECLLGEASRDAFRDAGWHQFQLGIGLWCRSEVILNARWIRPRRARVPAIVQRILVVNLSLRSAHAQGLNVGATWQAAEVQPSGELR